MANVTDSSVDISALDTSTCGGFTESIDAEVSGASVVEEITEIIGV